MTKRLVLFMSMLTAGCGSEKTLVMHAVDLNNPKPGNRFLVKTTSDNCLYDVDSIDVTSKKVYLFRYDSLVGVQQVDSLLLDSIQAMYRVETDTTKGRNIAIGTFLLFGAIVYALIQIASLADLN